MRHKGKYFNLIICTIWLVLLLAFPFTAFSQIKDKIRMGCAISLSGPYAAGANVTQISNYEMWLEAVNAKGGIFVKEYGKRLPVEVITYDDRSDHGTVVKLVEKLILEDKVDFLLPPWGNAQNFAVAPVASKYGYPLVCPTIASMKIKEIIHTLPYFFVTLMQPDDVGAAILAVLKELNLKKVAVTYLSDLRAIELTGFLVPNLGPAGIEVALLKTYPLGSKDLSPILKAVKAAKVDGLIGFTYPDDTMLMTEQAMVVGLNPKLFYLDIGVGHFYYKDRFGAAKLEGVMGPGAWGRKDSPEAAAFADAYIKRWKHGPDWAGAAISYGSYQVVEQAIEKAGTLDRKKIRDVIATETFPTLAGNLKFVNGFNITFTGLVAQWQNGIFETIYPKEYARTKPIYPKPPWPRK
jgi:branched-chain amino acid transport system substrate-binding protein